VSDTRLVQIPTDVFLVGAAGHCRHQLGSVDDALFNSGVGNFNLIRVSSILPPFAVSLNEEASLNTLLRARAMKPGDPVYIAYGMESVSTDTEDPDSDSGRVAIAGVAIGLPSDVKSNGVIMELHRSVYCHGEGEREEACKSADRALRQMVDDAFKRRGLKLGGTEVRVAMSYRRRETEPNTTRQSWHTAFAGVLLLNNAS
jgi:arginine decarboxylase